MCLGKAYLEADNKRELVLDSIASLEIDGTKVKLSTIFGDQKELEASIKEIDFESSRIILTPIAAGQK
jgi:predicted RNA-binding protein